MICGRNEVKTPKNIFDTNFNELEISHASIVFKKLKRSCKIRLQENEGKDFASA